MDSMARIPTEAKMKHYNQSITERVNRTFNPKGESLSDDIDGIVAVVPLVPAPRIIKSSVASSSGTSNTFHTTPTDKDFYLSALQLSIVKDSTCDVATGSLTVATTVDGAVVQLARVPIVTLLAQLHDVTIPFPIPVKIDRGVNITTTQGTFTAGNFLRSLTLIGYNEEVTK